MTDKPTRRDLMKPIHLLGWSLAAALFAGLVTALSMGAFSDGSADLVAGAWRLAAIVAGIVFIVVVLILALLLLVVDPAEVTSPKDGPVLVRDAAGDEPGAGVDEGARGDDKRDDDPSSGGPAG